MYIAVHSLYTATGVVLAGQTSRPLRGLTLKQPLCYSSSRGSPRMAIDFSFPPDVEDVRMKVRSFLEEHVKPREKAALDGDDRRKLLGTIIELRKKAHEE